MSNNKNNRKIYCSGPLFCNEEMKVMALISSCLENNGFRTYLPHRDGVEAFVLKSMNSTFINSKVFKKFNTMISKYIFMLDIYQLVKECDCLVFNMNGRIPDEGGIVETAAAFTLGIPVVIFKDDCRSYNYGYDSFMALGLSGNFKVVSSIDKLPEAINQINNVNSRLSKTDFIIPETMKKSVKYGKIVNTVLKILHFIVPKIFKL